MKLYKLTDEHGQTQNNTQWGEGVTHTADMALPAKLCTEGVLHAYRHPVLAVLLNTAHADLKAPRLWEAEGDVVINEGLKVGCRSLTTLREIELPVLTPEQRVTFAIKCALKVYSEPSFIIWAENWLSGKDRTAETAQAVWVVARAASDGARVASDATRAAWAAARAAWDVVRAPDAVVSNATWAAVETDWVAAETGKRIDFVVLAESLLAEELERKESYDA